MNIIQPNTAFWIMVAVAIAAIASFIIYRVLRNPFHFPYMRIPIDVSGKRKPDMMEQIDEYLINGGFDEIQEHEDAITDWDNKCQEKIEKSSLKKYRQKQFMQCLDHDNAYCFELIKQQTRYKQVNYQKTSYKVPTTIETVHCNYQFLDERDQQLSEIGYECSLNKYESKNQRKLMTRKLREEIMKRDNYTCQMCGKYMPDEVGLQIDHIIPIAKGGKSVPSNLQVLCDKCNHKKFTNT